MTHLIRATVPLPLAIPSHKKKKKNFLLNLNVYRNAHFRVLAKVKHQYSADLRQTLRQLPKFKELLIVYTLYPKTNHSIDTANICSVVDKFFSDALVEHGVIVDDNHKILRQVTYRFGHIDPVNPRVDAELIGIPV